MSSAETQYLLVLGKGPLDGVSQRERPVDSSFFCCLILTYLGMDLSVRLWKD